MNNYIIRKKTDKQFIYTDKNNTIIKDKKYINNILKNIYIPPSYNNVKININKNEKILAIGIDTKNRNQYIYSNNYIEKQSKKKFNKLYNFGKKYNIILKKINKDLDLNDEDKNKQIAIILKLIIDCNFRVGNEKYCKEYNSYGVTTLKKKHIKINNKTNKITIDFNGKKNVRNKCEVRNPKIIRTLKKKKYEYYDDEFIFDYKLNNNYYNISSNDVNNYLKQFGDFTTKIFRTWSANIKLIKYLINLKNKNLNIKKKLNISIEQVSEKLHHTKNVCRKNYLDKKLINLFINNNNLFYSKFDNSNYINQYINFLK